MCVYIPYVWFHFKRIQLKISQYIDSFGLAPTLVAIFFSILLRYASISFRRPHQVWLSSSTSDTFTPNPKLLRCPFERCSLLMTQLMTSHRDRFYSSLCVASPKPARSSVSRGTRLRSTAYRRQRAVKYYYVPRVHCLQLSLSIDAKVSSKNARR